MPPPTVGNISAHPAALASSPSPSTPPVPPPPRYNGSTGAPSESDEDARPAKRQKTQACLRCRRRKQKCDNQKPCGNCLKADEQCYSASHPPRHVEGVGAGAAELLGENHLTRLADISALEERISRIEQMSLRPALSNDLGDSASSQGQAAESLGYHATDPLPSAFQEAVPLPRSTPAVALLATFAAHATDQSSPRPRADSADRCYARGDVEGVVDVAIEEALFTTYEDKVHWRYPFLRLHQLRDRNTRSPGPCTAFFVRMIYSIGLLLERNSRAIPCGHRQEDFYRMAVTRYLAHVFNQPDHLLHIQAYLLLAMHALYSPSTERIITITSAAMRYCVMAQLHCAAAEPEPVDVAARVRIQIRRRIFWCAYKLDRTVGATYHLPFSLPDAQITAKLYANIDDRELEEKCRAAFPDDPRGIQSKILNSTLHRDFSSHIDRNDRWRLQVLDKLDRWKSLWDCYADTPSVKLGGNDWINMMYSYSLCMLYQPTKVSVLNSAGVWTVKACVQACLIFRKFQRDTQVAELWLGLLTQFKCGVALLYTFFATPPQVRPAVYEHPDVSEAVRACSITLTLIAERWPESRCIRNTFDILAREIPLFEHASARIPPATRRVRQESSDALLSLLKELEPIVIHRDTLRMIREIATEDFPSHSQAPAEPAAPPQIYLDSNVSTAPPPPPPQQQDYVSPARHPGIVEDFFQPLTPSGLDMDGLGLDQESLADISIEFPAYFDLSDYV
ncbi:hypothetical protein B0I35DRAFT_475532 [Stachybotrys elegans]|uniref:Zn(2)-C6 fungal-type domain-containing protein n=1 Tax=Stachybotrys elegans TaxID=80388 RepID=A0A8K0WTL8_9HYPO|nr:hypothetical protein B0I35DRAFT_475532 [Stachybotrys elegans]